ncbi:hypothetical protein KIH39_02255 [Telmatocola sphagniphila]|uniref:HEAT repeat domain-containing protein n=1 Tax=Telmatocola sphagniphila TaxID=1123043 RepID=A0A8E6ETR8_9BACT|nr:hypothetical protein [Telmatocola sphagniphila]QVL32764.1 hypothetical protein KIH39_02255 [Telmatocola sphagniphila]
MIVPILLAGLGGVSLLCYARRERLALPKSFLPSAPVPSPVSRQHLHLYKGGELNAVAVEAAKSHWREKLDRGNSHIADVALRPGLQFVIQVRALAELGGSEAAKVLERQLGRDLSDDPIEQSWYWIDLAQGLREMSHVKSLPSLLQHVDKALELPLGHLYAAELVSFPAFQEHLNNPLSSHGQACLRVLHATLTGIRQGYLSASLYVEAQLGEALHTLSEACPDSVDPLVARVFLESLRILRRNDHILQILREDPSKAQAYRWQSAYLKSAEPIIREYLHEIELDLGRNLALTRGREQSDLLKAIYDFHTDSSEIIVQLLQKDMIADRSLGFACLQHGKTTRATSALLYYTRTILNPKRSFWFGVHSFLETSKARVNENLAAIKALRAHPSMEAETILLQLTHTDSVYRPAALASLGWWEPIHRKPVIETLRRGMDDLATRDICLCALARLGELAAISELQNRLIDSNAEMIHQTIDLLMDEGVTYLWPDLDTLTEHDDTAVSSHAWEVIERMRENFLGPLD